MKLKVRDIQASGVTFRENVSPADIDLLEEFVNQEMPVGLLIHAERPGDVVLIKAEVTFGLENHCGRCLERLSSKVTWTFDLDFDIAPGVEYIDVGERIREEMLVAHVPWALCREDCQGICPGCGAELNTEACECKNKE
ncbi:MAG: DUF177 domain-containing protein [Candidatus Omnitrophica bacterium]|nr:DUF177 domain-containing protein [Candidatus Omnitrophota bacterium]